MGRAEAGRAEALRIAVDAVVQGAVPEWPDQDPFSLALGAFCASFRLEHARARELAARAIRSLDAGDAEGRVLAFAVRALAAAGAGVGGSWTGTAPGECPSGDPLADAAPLLDGLPDTATATFARYAFAEAALACGRVSLALRTAPRAAGGFLGAHPFSAVVSVLAARAACFAGRVDLARELLPPRDPLPPRVALLADATRCLVAGNAADRAEVRGIADRLHGLRGPRRDRIESGSALLCAYGALGLGDVPLALRLAAGTDRDRAMVIDRVIVDELLVHGAIRADDLGAAEAWSAHAETFADDRIADSTVDRARSRLALAAGDPEAAILFADRSIRRADREGRAIESAEGAVLAARARVAAGRPADAARVLEPVTHGAERDGFLAMRKASGRVLRETGRRLRPAPGSRAAGLSPREQEVLPLLLEGWENAAVAERLHISEHTARVHVSRILAAFGAPTRVALIAQVRWDGAPPDPSGWSELTPRQRAVVAAAVEGRAAAEIAERLGITERTVQKHLRDAKERWGVRTRLELAVRAAGS